jgi:glycine dehydrogenase subunit 1
LNDTLLGKKIIGGLALDRFYPELADCVLLCATEITPRASMDELGKAFAS